MPLLRAFHPSVRRPLSGAVLAIALACCASPALAGVENPADTAAVHAVRLDMPLVKRLAAVQRAVEDVDDAPHLYARTKEHKVPKTLDELVAEVHTCPPLEAAIKAQGFTPESWLLAAMALADAGLGYQLRASGHEEMLKGQNISEAHMAFIKAHLAELAGALE